MGSIISKPKAPTPPPQSSSIPPALVTIANLDPKVKALSSPTTAEVSQATATEMDAKGLKRRRRGRSPTILTGAAGVQEAATLGIPTLLG
jgi:hypothetical protein